ncbi:MAG: hypothetical protein EZS28_040145, partial [Streblomastix strix]
VEVEYVEGDYYMKIISVIMKKEKKMEKQLIVIGDIEIGIGNGSGKGSGKGMGLDQGEQVYQLDVLDDVLLIGDGRSGGYEEFSSCEYQYYGMGKSLKDSVFRVKEKFLNIFDYLMRWDF